MQRRKLLALTGGSVSLALAGCTDALGGDDESEDEPEEEVDGSNEKRDPESDQSADQSDDSDEQSDETEELEVQIIAGYPDPDDDTEPLMEEVLTNDSFESDAHIQKTGRDTGPSVSVSLTEAAAEDFAETMIDTSFTREGRGNCDFDPETDEPDPNQHCLYTVLDGEIVHGAAMGDLAEIIDPDESGDYSEWVADGAEFTINTATFEDAERLAASLHGEESA